MLESLPEMPNWLYHGTLGFCIGMFLCLLIVTYQDFKGKQ